MSRETRHRPSHPIHLAELPLGFNTIPPDGWDGVAAPAALFPARWSAETWAEFNRWRWEAVAVVCEVARDLGFSVGEISEAVQTGSVYVKLKRPGSHGVRVRLADHRSRVLGPREFSVRWQAAGRLVELRSWLGRLRTW